MIPSKHDLRNGLTAQHYGAIDALVIQNKTEVEVAGEFSIDLSTLRELRYHPVWSAQERAMVSVVKEASMTKSMESLIPKAIEMMEGFLDGGGDPSAERLRFLAAKAMLDYSMEMYRNNHHVDAAPPIDVFTPKWMNKEKKIPAGPPLELKKVAG